MMTFIQGEEYTFTFEINGMDFDVQVIFTGDTKEGDSKGKFAKVGTDKTYTLRKSEAIKLLATEFDNVVKEW